MTKKRRRRSLPRARLPLRGHLVALVATALVATACTSETGSTWSYAPLAPIDARATSEATAPTEATPGLESIDGGTAEAQYVTDVARGFALYQVNCAACHGVQGQGGLGPRLNDPAKLSDAITATGESGSGHLNPIYLDTVLTVGGSYVCGDPDSVMVAYKEPNGHLSSRQVEELVAWITASSEISFETGSGMVSGWRDPDWEPGAEATPVPACWQD